MNLRRLVEKLSVFGVALFFSTTSFGQNEPLGGFLPGPVLPEQVSKALTQKPKVPQEPGPALYKPEENAPTPGGEEAKKIKFKLNGIILEGNHVYSTRQLAAIYRRQLHKMITIADLFGIVQNITNYYRNNGYIISRAILPPQHVKDGVVRIQIIEGYIGKIDVAGEPHGARCLVAAIGRHIKECPPLEISRMEKYMLLENEIPNTDVKAVLSPAQKAVGAADLTLVTQNKPFGGYLSYDNYGTRYIGPQQMTANIAASSFITSGDLGQATFTKTPKGGELTYLDMNYNGAIGDEGKRWLIGGTRAHTHPLFVLQPAQIDGLNVNYYTGIQFPLIRRRTESLTLSVNFNYLDSEVTTIQDILLYADHLRPLGVGITYNFADRFYGANLLYADIRQGLPILGYTSNTNPDTARTSRPGGRGDFTKIDFQLNRLQGIRGPLSAYIQLRGQWAFNPLLASEQFTFGGSQLGRGYDVAEIIGDKGAAGSLELRYDYGLNKYYINAVQFYAFYDAGIIWNFKEIGGTPRKVSGTTAGFGMRFFMTKYVSGNVMWTQTLTKQVAAESLIGDGSRPRVFFSIVASF